MGGSNDSSNLVKLTAKEHYIVHKLLVEIYPNVKKLKYALWGMCNQLTSTNNKRNYIISSREYDRARKLFVETIKGRECTWGCKISKAKKGVSQGKRSKESIEKQKLTVSLNPYTLSEEQKEAVSKRMKNTVKTDTWKANISKTLKEKGIVPPYRGIPYTYNNVTYRSKQEASRVLKIPAYKL